MDPLTAGLQLANTLAQLWLVQMQSASPEKRQQMVDAHIDRMLKLERFFDSVSDRVIAYTAKDQK